MSVLYSYAQLQAEVGSNAERLAYIDFKLRFTGVIRRSDLNSEFGLAEAAASRMLSLYSEYRKDNFFHDRSLKANVIKVEAYQPLIPIEAEKALGMLSHGFNKNKLADNPLLPYRRIGHIPNQLDVDEVSKITRAIYTKRAISCCYISGNSCKHDSRELVPLALLNDGKNWIFRAYDRSDTKRSYKFKNFNFSRATKVSLIQGEEASSLNYESLSEDKLWNMPLPLFLEIHPKLNEEQKRTVRQDFGMAPEQSELFLTENAALVWILTKMWGIDVGNPKESELFFRFELKNKEMIRPYL